MLLVRAGDEYAGSYFLSKLIRQNGIAIFCVLNLKKMILLNYLMRCTWR
jgi:hypothetical protein